MEKFRTVLEKLTNGVSYAGMVALYFSVAVAVVDVIMSLLQLGHVLGNAELVELCMIIMMYFGFGYCQMGNGHVRVDMFVNMMPPKVRCAVNGIVQCVCVFFCVLLCWQTWLQIFAKANSGTASQILHIPYAPFEALMFVGFVIFAITLAYSAIMYFLEIPNAKPIAKPE